MSKTQKMAFMTQDKIIKAQERGAETSENEKQQKEKAYGLLLSVLVITEEDGNGFHAFAPAFKGLHVGGSTQNEALENAKEAICVYIESLTMHHDPLPVGPYLKVQEPQFEIPELPENALCNMVEVQWPSVRELGIS